ncbi:hypothetical protein F4781DRAFT_104149 [Annulohypoxylon bovei var. microspora]|nr:hypothetical protein F4781DRAFT_104149 [Annulohypoxylon bovei var. microspora]
MDPVTAFASAGTVAAFIQMGYHLVLGFFIEKLGSFSESMISAEPTLDLSDAEKGMKSVALKCIGLSNRLIEILNRSRTKDPHSLRQSAIAAFHGLLNTNKKEELKKELDECQRLFHMQLTQMLSSNTVQSLKKLDELANSNQYIGSEIEALRQHIVELEKGVTLTGIGEEAANKLASLLKLSNDTLTLIKSHKILESLSFSKLHQRYETVGQAHSETFNWIFQDDPDRSVKALEGKILFTNWLSSGRGIFHIAGKPGSGKSTLMKFIYKHEKTKDLLDSWAAGRKLVVGKHFFWRPGEDALENSTTGLLQTLLYDILEKCPDLVPHVFPRPWAKIKDLPPLTVMPVILSRDDLHDAFDRLIDNRGIFENMCFFFMIDGLDEFQETRDEGYKQLIRLFSNWTTKAPEQIKVCVSSREHAVFLDHFSETQGLRLQDLTADDIYKYVREKLMSNPNFLEMEKPEDGANKLISEVTHRADGVFLWVALVVKLLDDACDDGDNFLDLKQKIDFLPPEIRGLFDQLFDSIRQSDRDESAQTFAVVLKLLKNTRGMRLSLLRYSFLDNYNVNPLFASRPSSPDQKFLDWNDESIRKRLKRTRKQLYKRCKGLLEVVESDDDPLPSYKPNQVSLKGKPLSQRISLIHRSIQEYLEEKQISEERVARTKEFDVIDAICQTYVAELIALKLKQPDCNDICYYPELRDIIIILSEAGIDAVRQGWITALQNLDKARRRYLDQDDTDLNLMSIYLIDNIIAIGRVFSVAHSAALFGLYTFFTTWENPSASPLDKDIRNGSLALAAIYGLLHYSSSSDSGCYLKIFRWLFDHGCSPNQAILKCYGGSLWWAIISHFSTNLDTWTYPYIYEVVETFLEFGANPEFLFTIREVDRDNERKIMVETIPPAAIGTSTIDSVYSFIQRLAGKDSKLFDLISSRGGRATLREFIEVIKPPNMDTLLTLIDRNMNAQQLDQPTLNHTKETRHDLPTPEQEVNTEASMEEPAATEQKLDSISADKNAEMIVAKHVGVKMITFLKRLINNPLATFILGAFLSYWFLIAYGSKGS